MSEMIGIIVDGDGDFGSLKRRFPEGIKILKTDGPRGHAAAIRDIAHKSKKQIGILKAFKCVHAIVLLDFEERLEEYDAFFSTLTNAFNGIPFGIKISVAVCNRMIENWYLADIEHLSRNKSFLRDKLKQKSYEGTHGKNEIKKCMKKGLSYSETKHGPELFEILRFDAARQNSPSLDFFLKILEAHGKGGKC